MWVCRSGPFLSYSVKPMKQLVARTAILLTVVLPAARLAAAQAPDQHVHDAAPAPPRPGAPPAQSSRERVSVDAVRVSQAPRVDGVLDEAVWRDAKVIDTFVQQEPNEGQPGSDRTEVRVLYDQ